MKKSGQPKKSKSTSKQKATKSPFTLTTGTSNVPPTNAKVIPLSPYLSHTHSGLNTNHSPALLSAANTTITTTGSLSGLLGNSSPIVSGGSTGYIGGNCTPAVIPSPSPFISSGTISSGYVYTPPVLTVNDRSGEQILEIGHDPDENRRISIVVGVKSRCKNKVEVLPGIIVFSPHKAPGIFRRFFFKLFLGWKWESTLVDNFIDAL